MALDPHCSVLCHRIAEAGAHGRVRSASSAARSIRTGSGATKVVGSLP